MTKEEVLAQIVGHTIVKAEVDTWMEKDRWLGRTSFLGDDLILTLDNGIVLDSSDWVRERELSELLKDVPTQD